MTRALPAGHRRGRLARALAALGIVLGAALSLAAPVATVASAAPDPNDFVFDSFDVEYELSRDEAGHSQLHVVESIVARFPEYDQNRGLQRAIPLYYDGHGTSIEVLSVTDERGNPRPYVLESDGEFMLVTSAVPKGEFVHGTQTYVIEYTQRDVTMYFADTDADEFYWDINGTGWAQPFARVSASLTLTEDLAEQFSGAAGCFRGADGEDTACEITVEGLTLRVSQAGLGPYENVTIAIGFMPGTFVSPPAEVPIPDSSQYGGQPNPFFTGSQSFLTRVPLLMYAGIGLGTATLAFVVVTAVRTRRGVRTGRAIIAQYEPPEHTSVALSAEILRVRPRAMTATLIDLAVRRKTRLLYDQASNVYGAQAVSDAGLLPIEKQLYDKLFGGAQVDGTYRFDRKSVRLGDANTVMLQAARAEAVKHGFVRKLASWPKVVASLGFIATVLFFVAQLGVALGFFAVLSMAALWIHLILWPVIGLLALLSVGQERTMAGALLHDHLMGLREFIRLAEADRIRMLQSASGAEVSEERVVQLYERLLPYAVLFGQENEWQGELAKYYRETSPDWFGGNHDTFARSMSLHALTSSVMSSPKTQVRSSSSSGGGFRGSSGFSSSGGSRGGGFSGGGGGGGGGRGI